MSNSEGLQRDYERVTSGTGFIELPDLSTVTVTGADRVSFLHNLCTNDIKGLSTGESCEAFFADVKGKIVGQVIITAGEDQVTMLTAPQQADVLIAHLDRYIIREDVQLISNSDELAWFVAIAGDARTQWIESEEIPHVAPSIYGTIAGSFLGVASSDRIITRETFVGCGLAECDRSIWETLRVEDQLPIFGIDFDASHLPQEVNRDHMAINFNKGCYLGQETIARIDALGHVNKKIVQLEFASQSVPPVGAELIHVGKVVGKVTSSCWSPKSDAPLAIAMVARSANDEGTKLESDFGTATVL